MNVNGYMMFSKVVVKGKNDHIHEDRTLRPLNLRPQVAASVPPVWLALRYHSFNLKHATL